MTGKNEPQDRIETRSAGIALLASAVLAVFVMLHHPTGAHGHTPLVAGLSLANLVHAAMLVLLGVQLWAFTVYSRWRGLAGWVLPALIVYAIAFVGHLVAATVNGFVVPAVAARVDAAAVHDLFVMLWQLNQAFAQLGVYATGLAILFWSVDLLTAAGRRSLPAGAAGIALAILPALALLTGMVEMNVQGALLIYAAHMIWVALAGAGLLIHRR